MTSNIYFIAFHEDIMYEIPRKKFKTGNFS